MMISAHQPAFMPWLGYLHKVMVSDKFVILDDVQFEKNSFTNRNYIMGHNGVILLTVPIKLKNHMKSKIFDIKISNEINWKKKHLNSIYLNYKNSPYFKVHFHFFEKIYSDNWNNLLDLNTIILKYLLKVFEIETEIVRLSDLDINGTKTELILNLCKKLGSNQFIFGLHGREYADYELAKKNRIEFLFQNFKEPELPYRRIKPDKILSSIDLIFNLKQSSLKEILLSNGKIEN